MMMMSFRVVVGFERCGFGAGGGLEMHKATRADMPARAVAVAAAAVVQWWWQSRINRPTMRRSR